MVTHGAVIQLSPAVFWHIKWEHKFARLIAKGTCTNGGVRLETKHSSAYLGQRWDDLFLLVLLFLQVVLVLLARSTTTRIPLRAVSWFFRTTRGIIFRQNGQIYLRNLREGWGCFGFTCPASKRTKHMRQNCCHLILDESLEYKVVIRPKQHDMTSFYFRYVMISCATGFLLRLIK